MIARIKQLVRVAKERTLDALWSCIGKLLNTFPIAECTKYIQHAGYSKK